MVSLPSIVYGSSLSLQRMIEDGQGSSRAPHGLLLLFAFGIMLTISSIIGDRGEAVSGASSELLSPVKLLLVPLILVFTIRFLSSDWGLSVSRMLATGEWCIPRGTTGTLDSTPLFLVLVLALLYCKVSIFGGD